MKEWMWNEFRQIGTDYANVDEVANYDARMRKMRDVDAENRSILEMLELPEQAMVMEIGTGTGAFARAVAPFCREITAVDISPVMLEYASHKAAGIDNINFVRAGFLTFESPDETLDAVVTGMAFHHLPDVWKIVALNRIFRALKPGGRLIVLDVVFCDTSDVYFERLIEANTACRPNLVRHIACEYSTVDWIMEQMFERAGFKLKSKSQEQEFLATYCVEK